MSEYMKADEFMAMLRDSNTPPIDHSIYAAPLGPGPYFMGSMSTGTMSGGTGSITVAAQPSCGPLPWIGTLDLVLFALFFLLLGAAIVVDHLTKPWNRKRKAAGYGVDPSAEVGVVASVGVPIPPPTQPSVQVLKRIWTDDDAKLVARRKQFASGEWLMLCELAERLMRHSGATLG